MSKVENKNIYGYSAEAYAIGTKDAEKRLQTALLPIINTYYANLTECAKIGSDAVLRWMAQNESVFFTTRIEREYSDESFWNALCLYVMMHSVTESGMNVSGETQYLCVMIKNRAWDYIEKEYGRKPYVRVMCLAVGFRVVL